MTVILARERDLLLDLLRIVGIGGEDEHHGLGALDRIDNRVTIIVAGADVALGDPAFYSVFFEGIDDRSGLFVVERGMRNENRGTHE
jgi:precorrin-2 methylase